MTHTPGQLSDLNLLYQNLLNVSSALLNDFSDENIFETIQKRGHLLNEIENRTNMVKCKSHSILKADHETNEIIAKLIDIDKSISVKIKTRLSQIRSELNGLNVSSRAAAAYSMYVKK